MTAVAVSVLIPCHNSADFLTDALRSVQDQTLRDFECIIIDDASTDDSVAIAERFARADPRFQLLSLKENVGVSVARNAGLAQALGRWVAMLDSDDLYVPKRLENLTRIGDLEGADIVFDDQIVTTFPGTISANRAFGFPRSQFTFTQEDFFCSSRLFGRSLATGYMKPLLRRDFLCRHNAAYDPTALSGEDFLFYARLFATDPLCIGTNIPGYIYRRRRGSLSRSETHLHFHAQLGEQVLNELGPLLSSRSRAALAARRRDFEQLANAMPALAALRRRDWFRLLLSLVEQPRAIVTCLRLAHRQMTRSWAASTTSAMGLSEKDSGGV